MPTHPQDTSIQAPDRRRLLANLGAGLSMIGAGVWQSPAIAANRLPAAQARWLELVTQPDARSVGRAVLPALGHPTKEALVDRLSSRMAAVPGQVLAASCCFEDLHQAFEQTVRADFAAGHCLQVGGWVLARTEVELCALAALAA